MQAQFARAVEVTRATAELMRAPRLELPSEATARYLRNDRGAWNAEQAPELVEPLDLLVSRDYGAIVFAGPPRTGKTFTFVHGAWAWIVKCAPADTLIIQMSQVTARDFSRMEVDRCITHSPEISAALSPRAKDDNTFDKFFRSGMVLKLGWPAISQLSSKTLRFAICTDHDRIENRDNVDGEGPLFDQLRKRTDTYMSRGKTVVESSPNADLIVANWKAETPHEAPPVSGGILELYNRGTRARRYWPCLQCGEYFEAEPGYGLFALPDFEQLVEQVKLIDLAELAARYSKVVHKACGGIHDFAQRREMRARGRWVHEGQSIDRDGNVVGRARHSDIASFWTGGVCMGLKPWSEQVYKYLQAVQTFATIGDESSLKFCTNSDQAAVYVPRAVARRKGAETLKARATHWPQGLVPQAVRFLINTVDVHAGRFVVQVHGWGVGLEGWIIDRYDITSSRRKEGDRTAAVNPAAFAEDWDLLLEQVVDRAYPYEDALDQKLIAVLTLVDSGGKAGVTTRAYDFWRRAREAGYGERMQLVKGTGAQSAARCALSWPDSRGRTDRHSGGAGDVPVWLINTNLLKDAVSNDYAREESGPGYVHIPDWLRPSWFDELFAETRTERGWERKKKLPNEAFDLHCYARAGCIVLGAEKIDWEQPPAWAAPFDQAMSLSVPSGRGVRSRGLQ